MNPLVLFLPAYKASTTAYLLGIGVLAVLDFLRMSTIGGTPPGLVGMLAIWVFVFSLHANRRRHAGRDIGLAALPVGIAVIGKFIGAIVGAMIRMMFDLIEFAAANGVDTADQAALEEALNDQEFLDAFTRTIEQDPEYLPSLVEASQPASFIGFWLVIAAFAIWFFQMRKPPAPLS